MSFTAGSTYGEYKHTLTINEMPSHTHSGIPTINPNYNMQGGGKDVNYHILNSTTRSTTTYATGGSAAHNNIQPYIVVFFWRRTE